MSLLISASQVIGITGVSHLTHSVDGAAKAQSRSITNEARKGQDRPLRRPSALSRGIAPSPRGRKAVWPRSLQSQPCPPGAPSYRKMPPTATPTVAMPCKREDLKEPSGSTKEAGPFCGEAASQKKERPMGQESSNQRPEAKKKIPREVGSSGKGPLCPLWMRGQRCRWAEVTQQGPVLPLIALLYPLPF
jgi:hypothetical protein